MRIYIKIKRNGKWTFVPDQSLDDVECECRACLPDSILKAGEADDD